MKQFLQKSILVALCLLFVACQTTPKAKAVAAMSDGGKQAVYITGPVSSEKKEHPVWKKVLIVTAGVIVVIPIAVLTGLASSGSQR